MYIYTGMLNDEDMIYVKDFIDVLKKKYVFKIYEKLVINLVGKVFYSCYKRSIRIFVFFRKKKIIYICIL